MKMWDGRFSKPPERLMEEFNNSLSIDKSLIEEDIAGSMAWAHALENVGVLSKGDNRKIQKGLQSILKEYRTGTVVFEQSDEDIHMAIERLLKEKIGEAGSRLHTGRSRNDQVATDFRLYVKRSLRELISLVKALQQSLLHRAQSEKEIVIPGYTHLQQAQPISLAHYWLSFFFLLERDKKRCRAAMESTDIMPLGSGAMAGAGFPVDRKELAKKLGFSALSANSIDGVSSRDFALETLSAVATLAVNLSRYAEDLIVWASQEFSFIEIDDAWSTGSSMMPQKKNPDSLELIRGKCGRFIGNHTRFAVTLKGVGLSYCKDLQEDKEPVIDSITQIKLVLQVFTRVIATLKIQEESIAGKMDSLLFATDLADYLVNKNLPFRQAHRIVGRIVRYCLSESLSLDSVSLEKYRKFCELFDRDLYTLFNWKKALAHRDIYGGTGPRSLKKQIETALKLMKS